MNFLQAILLGLLQGITEFLPISSSGHLIIAESLLGLDISQLKDFDIVLHVGTLLAIVLYFWKDFLKPKLWPLLILGSLPAMLVGFFLEDLIDATFRSAQSVAVMLVVVGLLFFLPSRGQESKITPLRAFLMGCAQAVAIIPGVSRSGSTIWTGTLLGLKREEAARFSFLLGSIAIAGAGFLTALDLDSVSLAPSLLLTGFLSAFLSSLLAIVWLMRFLKNHSLKAFGVYRIVLGLILILWL